MATAYPVSEDRLRSAMFEGMYDDPEERALLAVFLGKSVTARTLKGYQPGFKTWAAFIASKTPVGMEADPYLKGHSAATKVSLMCTFLRVRHAEGRRDKQCTGITAAISKFFSMELQQVEWMKDPLVTLARRSCRRTAKELREYVESGASKARLPVWLGLLELMREELWEGKRFVWGEIDEKMTYIASIYSFELAVRAGEATYTGADSEEHTVLAEDFKVHLFEPIWIGGKEVLSLRAGSEAFANLVVPENVKEIEVCALTQKTGMCNNSKLIARRSWEEMQVLEDLIDWAINSGARSKDRFFSRSVAKPTRVISKKKCTSSMVTQALKAAVWDKGYCRISSRSTH